MAKSVTAMKEILRLEERLLEKLTAAAKLLAHKESKATVREAIRKKKGDIREYKAILKRSSKCPAVMKRAPKKAAPSGRKAGRAAGGK